MRRLAPLCSALDYFAQFRRPGALSSLLIAPFFASSLLSQQINQDSLLQWMDQIAQQQLQRREATITEIHSVADAEHRKQFVRQKMFSLLGGLPDYRSPLHPRITGRINAENYVIEKGHF